MRVERARTPVGACAPRLLAVVALTAAVFTAQAQSADAPPAPPATVPPAIAAPESKTDAETRLAPVEITGSRPDDVQERRNSTAAKIIIGREEIDRFGDSTLGEVLKRLPGVTIQGRPGRGGAIRLRGLGSGYTQILLDGERVPPGFSLDSLTPDQIERIEILRAPTAETGARAIAGTINIVTRGGYSRRVNDVRLTAGYENGHLQPSVSWTRNFSDGPFIVNYSLSAFAYDRDSSSTNTTVDQRLDDGTVTLAQVDEGRLRVRGGGVNATARIQWRSDDGIDSATLTPIAFVHDFRSERQGDADAKRGRDAAAVRPGVHPRDHRQLAVPPQQRVDASLRADQPHRAAPRYRPGAPAGARLSHRVHGRQRVANARGHERLARHDDHRQRQVDRDPPRGAQPGFGTRGRVEPAHRYAHQPAGRPALSQRLRRRRERLGRARRRLRAGRMEGLGTGRRMPAYAGKASERAARRRWASPTPRTAAASGRRSCTRSGSPSRRRATRSASA